MILLTGSTGLIGSRLLFDLVSTGQRVRAMKRPGSSMQCVERIFGNEKLQSANIEWFDGDVTDLFAVEEALEGIDTVYHNAALISFYPSERRKMMKTNVQGTANMVNLSIKKEIKRFCHVSSVAALGRIDGEKYINENSWWKTSSENSNYAISKYGGEREVWRGMEEGLSAFIINPTIVIGPGDWKSGSSQMFAQVNKGLPFYSEGVTGWVDVRDVSRSAIMLMEKGVSNERFIINSENAGYRYVFDQIAENLGKKKSYIRISSLMCEIGWRFEYLRNKITQARPMLTKETARNGMMVWEYSNEKIKKEIGIEFISIRDSVKETCKYFQIENSK